MCLSFSSVFHSLTGDLRKSQVVTLAVSGERRASGERTCDVIRAFNRLMINRLIDQNIPQKINRLRKLLTINRLF